jgi:hypothetical protein
MFEQAVQQENPCGIVAAIRRLGNLALFRRDVPITCAWDIVGWWETRRVPYNLIVGGTGILTCIVVAIFVAGSILFFDADFGSPLSGLVGILIYGVMANICFTFGWVAELVVRKAWPRQADRFATESFSLGLGVSVLLTLTPAVLAVVIGVLYLMGRLLHVVHK